MGPLFVRAFDFQGRSGVQTLREAMAILADLDGDWRRPLPDNVPTGHIERRWRRHVMTAGGIDRTHWEMATYSALSNALASGGIWVPTARVHRASMYCLRREVAVPCRSSLSRLAIRTLARRESGKAR
jgi:hypothetical protein